MSFMFSISRINISLMEKAFSGMSPPWMAAREESAFNVIARFFACRMGVSALHGGVHKCPAAGEKEDR